MSTEFWLWLGFALFVLSMLYIDLAVFHRRAHVVGIREAAAWYSVWLALALLFAAGVFLWLGRDKGLEFVTSYTVELSLSIDNVFVFLVIFAEFGIPARYQHRVLFYGILGALVMRGIFIGAGVALLDQFDWLVYLFGAFLLFTAVRLALRRDREADPRRNPIVRVARRWFRCSSDYDEQRFFTRRNGVLMATPLFLALLVVESTDVIFAVDSVPAVLSITRDPFIVYTSNVFAILGLRALFFLMSGFLSRFRYLKSGLIVVLALVGLKMLVSEFYEVSAAVSLGVIAGVVGTVVLASYLAVRLGVRDQQV